MAKKANKKKGEDASDDSFSIEQDKKNVKGAKNIEKKQKLGKKKEKEPGEKKAERNKSGAPLGRPSEKNKIEVAEDPTAAIQEIVLLYLDKIGLKHGLVFRKEERAKMNQDKKMQRKWNQNHEWNEEREKEKIQKNEYFQAVIKKFHEFIKKALTVDQLTQTYISIGDLTVDECTQQMYRIISAVLESHMAQESEAQLNERSKQLFDDKDFYYFSRKFATTHIKYWVQISNNLKQAIPKQFIDMMREMRTKLIDILTRPDKQAKLIKFLQEEQEMSQALKKIIQTGRRNNPEPAV